MKFLILRDLVVPLESVLQVTKSPNGFAKICINDRFSSPLVFESLETFDHVCSEIRKLLA